MKRIIIIIIIGIVCFMIGSVVQAKDIPKDSKCDNIAKFAQGIATIKLAGYDLNALSSFVSEPKVATFPLQIVKQQIFGQDLAPDVAYTKYYGQCVAVGYDALYEYYTHEQERQQLQLDNASLKSENIALQAHLVTAQKQIADLISGQTHTKHKVNP